MTAKKIIVAQCHQGSEKNHVTCDSPEEAGKVIADGNATAAKGWNWRIANITFLLNDGSEMSTDQANEIRRACGCNEW